jgi:peptidoglycan/LPS O-acetylase OafA/YrhL
MEQEKIKYLDGLRGLAALVVVFHHYFFGFYPAFMGFDIKYQHFSNEKILSGTPLNLLFAGNFAVCIFFVLSGYVLSCKYHQKKENDIITQSAIRRYFRLAIPIVGSILIYYLFIKYNLMFNLKMNSTANSPWLNVFFDFGHNWKTALYQGFIGVFFETNYVPNVNYNPNLWTINYELFGSFIIFSFLLIFGKIRQRYIFYVVLILLLYKTYYSGFVLGMMISDLHYHKTHIFKQKPYIYLITLVIGLFFGSFPTYLPKLLEINSLSYEINSIIYHTIGSAFVVFSVISLRTARNIFSSKPFVFLGNVSFSTYLLHQLVLCSFSCWFFLQVYRFTNGKYNLSFLIMFLISVPLIFIISNYFYKYVDATGIRFARYISKKLTSKKISNGIQTDALQT